MMNHQVVGIGIATVDILTIVNRLPGSDEVFEADSVEIQGGGPVATALVTLARLGASAAYVGSIVRDRWGEIILNEFNTYGVDSQYYHPVKEGQTPISVILVEKQNGKRSILYHMKNLPLLKPGQLPLQVITRAKILHLDGTFPAAALKAAKIARESGTKVSLDGGAGKNWETQLELLPLVDILIVARSFASQVTGQDDPARAGEEMLKYGPEFVVITDGDNGCWYRDRDQFFHQPAFPVEVQDTTGAGDVFHGAYLYAFLQGWHPRKSARFASMTAALKCTQIGGRKGIPDLKGIIDFEGNQKGVA